MPVSSCSLIVSIKAKVTRRFHLAAISLCCTQDKKSIFVKVANFSKTS